MYDTTTPKPITHFRQLPGGMYLVKQPSRFPLIEHYGIVVTGNLVRQFGVSNIEPIVIHQTYPNARVEWAEATGVWDFVGEVPPEMIPSAMARVSIAFSDPTYDLFANNCEQVARFVSVGEKTSTQLWAVGLGGAVAIAIWFLNRNNN